MSSFSVQNFKCPLSQFTNANSDEFSFESVVSEPPLNCIDIHRGNLRETYYRIPILFFCFSANEVVFCYTIIEKNKRSFIPVAGSSTFSSSVAKHSMLNQLDTFFPFDPYLLKRWANIHCYGKQRFLIYNASHCSRCYKLFCHLQRNSNISRCYLNSSQRKLQVLSFAENV